jgi:hypothetical protein
MRINEYLEKYAKKYDLDYGHEFQKILDGRPDTTKAAKIWAWIAKGEADVAETLVWAQHVAKQIDANVIHSDVRDHAPAALKAIGFYGPADDDRRAKDYMQIISEFACIDKEGNELPGVRYTGSQWVRALKLQGFFDGVKEKTAINKVNKWRKELGIE